MTRSLTTKLASLDHLSEQWGRAVEEARDVRPEEVQAWAVDQGLIATPMQAELVSQSLARTAGRARLRMPSMAPAAPAGSRAQASLQAELSKKCDAVEWLLHLRHAGLVCYIGMGAGIALMNLGHLGDTLAQVGVVLILGMGLTQILGRLIREEENAKRQLANRLHQLCVPR